MTLNDPIYKTSLVKHNKSHFIIVFFLERFTVLSGLSVYSCLEVLLCGWEVGDVIMIHNFVAEVYNAAN